MGMILSLGFIFLIIGGYLLYAYLKERSFEHKPMHRKYLKPDGTFKVPNLAYEERMHGSARCPICRKNFACGSSTDPRHVECPECGKKISATGDDFRPDFLTNERDWQYIKQHKWTIIFWIIYSDYKHEAINAEQARDLVHRIVPEDFGKIQPFKYREFRDFTKSHHSHLDSVPDQYCIVCGNMTCRCTCQAEYEKDLRLGGSSFPELKPSLDKLRELNPQLVLSGYYKENGQIHARLMKRKGFDIKDYITLSDWQVIRYIINRAKYEEYTENDILTAREAYIKLIKTDLEMLISYHEARARGECPAFPFLPSTNPAEVRESTQTNHTETLHDKLMKEFYQA